jgi:RNA polymerase sigma-70 factor (ECF subfamily)
MEILAASTRKRVDPGAIPMITFSKPMESSLTLRQVFEAEESSLLRYAFGLVGQRETAEDLVQEAFLKLHAHWSDVENPKAWLFRTIRNLALNHLRDHKRETILDASKEWESGVPNPEHAIGKMEAVGTLQLLISELREEERQLIGLKYHEGLKYDQISERTGLSVGNVGYKLHHLLKSLGDAMRRLGIESVDG